MASLEGKSALITGGGQGIGRAIALSLGRAGANVAITYLRSERAAKTLARELHALGVAAEAIACDVAAPASIRNAAKAFQKRFGGLDILVNNAAIYETTRFAEITPEQWDRMLQINTRGPFLMTQAFVPMLRKRKGRIVNLSSLGGMRPWTSHAHYCVSKAALNMLTKLMAKALAPEISVNAVAPGLIRTERTMKNAELASIISKTPMRRWGTADDVAEAVCFFVTASPFITGQVLCVDGGLGLAT